MGLRHPLVFLSTQGLYRITVLYTVNVPFQCAEKKYNIKENNMNTNLTSQPGYQTYTTKGIKTSLPSYLFMLGTQLELSGLSSSQATVVIDRMLVGEKDSSMRGRWLDDPSGYPEQVFNVLWLICSRYALTTIDELWPRAWFRPCFLPPSEQTQFLADNAPKITGEPPCTDPSD